MSKLSFEVFKLYAEATKTFFMNKLLKSSVITEVSLKTVSSNVTAIASFVELQLNQVVYLKANNSDFNMNAGFYRVTKIVKLTDSSNNNIWVVAQKSGSTVTKNCEYLGLERLDSIENNFQTIQESVNKIIELSEKGSNTSTHNYLYHGVELTNFTWTQLSAKAKSGDFSGLNIGDYKTLELGSETIKMQIAGMDTYWRTGENQLGHHIDFISKDCMKTPYTMRSTSTNNGTSAQNNPWLTSELYTTLNTTIYNSLPTEIKNLIVNKRILLESRYSASGTLTDSTGNAWRNAGKLWLPTEWEVFGSVECGTKKSIRGHQCVQYPIFANSWLNRTKGLGDGGVLFSWWLPIAYSGSSSDFCVVHQNGYAGYSDATNHSGVPLCFRFA